MMIDFCFMFAMQLFYWIEFDLGNGIQHFYFNSETFSIPKVLEVIINKNRLPLFIHGSDGGGPTGRVVMCLRKLQCCKWYFWMFLSISSVKFWITWICCWYSGDTTTIQTEFVQYTKKKQLKDKDIDLLASFKISCVPCNEDLAPSWLLYSWSYKGSDSSGED